MSTPLYGQAAAGATATALSATPINCAAFEIKAPASNANPVFLGDANVTTGTGHQLDPGEIFGYQRSSFNGQVRFELKPSDFYVVGSGGGDKVTWVASPSIS